jgi:hypothetical protein
MSHLRLATLMATLGFALLAGGVGTAAAAPATQPLAKKVPITGTAKNGKRFTGTLTIDRFAKRNGKLFADGTLKGRLKGRTVRRAVSVPVSRPTIGTASTAQLPVDPHACQILNLVLGPINLNLLGLRVRTNQINVIIDAVPGAGNLLGNLLCGITNLLNPSSLASGPLGQLTQILNALLALAPKTA